MPEPRRYSPQLYVNKYKPAESGKGRKPVMFDENGLKICTKCGQAKTKESYYKASAMASGYSSRCIPCAQKANAESIEKHGRAPRKDRSKFPVVDGEKQCAACLAWYPVDDFEYRKHWGFLDRCKACREIANDEYIGKQRKSVDPVKSREYHLRSKYNLTPSDFDEMMVEQDGKCAICRCDAVDSKNGILHVDHDHKTGEVRGLLCNDCNITLGKFQDDVERFKSAIKYLEKF